MKVVLQNPGSGAEFALLISHEQTQEPREFVAPAFFGYFLTPKSSSSRRGEIRINVLVSKIKTQPLGCNNLLVTRTWLHIIN
jgi:hypothetical protein